MGLIKPVRSSFSLLIFCVRFVLDARGLVCPLSQQGCQALATCSSHWLASCRHPWGLVPTWLFGLALGSAATGLLAPS